VTVVLPPSFSFLREKAGEKLASGWSQDEDGNWIPPGWVRKDEAA
jgi:hypothetical protein